MNHLKNFIIALLLAILSINAYALIPTGTAVTAKATGFAANSNITFTWTAPAANTYKVWLQVPKGSTATTAVYRIYPKGNLVGNTVCSSTDATYPCFEISVNQALKQGQWLQLTANTTSQWSFTKNGYVTVNPVSLPTSEVLGVAVIRFETVTSVTPTPLAIGQAHQGGIIFYLDSTGKHGLIAAPNDQVATWSNSYTKSGATGTAIGTGKTNTATIITDQAAGGYAAKLCDDLVIGTYSDWYLPSKDELALIFTNLPQGTIASLKTDNSYWSSSENDANNAWAQTFYLNTQYTSSKNLPLYVRAIRAF